MIVVDTWQGSIATVSQAPPPPKPEPSPGKTPVALGLAVGGAIAAVATLLWWKGMRKR